ncbi:MAG TPA: glutamate-cysteine ligase family protein [Actinomycetota bacterium]
MGGDDLFTIGVEEEFLIVDPETRALRPRAGRIVAPARRTAGGNVESELQRTQIETGTGVSTTLAGVRRELVRLRREVAAAAEAAGSVIAATGTHPFSDWNVSEITPKTAYLRLEHDYQQLTREMVVSAPAAGPRAIGSHGGRRGPDRLRDHVGSVGTACPIPHPRHST